MFTSFVPCIIHGKTEMKIKNMRLSKYLLPTLKEKPKEAEIISHQYMLRAGMIRQLSAGIYNWLPLGKRVLDKVENIVREEMDKAGALELLMPTIQPAELWQESGRYGAYGQEMLRVKDRHERDMLYGPTAEEVVIDIFRKNVRSYKELPMNLYNIQWKFRDEVRPRFGVMRGREFLMKDAYSFDVDFETAKKTYDLMFRTYIKIFRRLGLKAIPVKADTGPIGGELSHEFQVMAQTGESQLYYDSALDKLLEAEEPDVDAIREIYAVADEKYDAANCPVPAARLKQDRGIEVGHIFYLGEKYSDTMNVTIASGEGKNIKVHSGCYGIGVSRLVGAIIEASHDENGIIWPESVAPFKVALLNLKTGPEACDAICEKIYADLQAKGVEVLYDDRSESAGAKFANADLIGIPFSIAIGPRGAENGVAEVKNRKTGEKKEVRVGEVLLEQVQK
jgi:prolyl-tRNA synthetase